MSVKKNLAVVEVDLLSEADEIPPLVPVEDVDEGFSASLSEMQLKQKLTFCSRHSQPVVQVRTLFQATDRRNAGRSPYLPSEVRMIFMPLILPNGFITEAT